MAARNVWRLWQEALKTTGNDADLLSGESLSIVPEVNDQGSFIFGNATKDMDVKVFLGGAGAFVLFDSGNTALTLSGVNAALAGGVAISGTSTIAGTVTDSSTTTQSGATTLTGTITASTDGGVLQKTNTATDDITVDATELNGLLTLNKAGVVAVTIPTPVGNTGKWIEITSLTAQAHTITAGANLIVGIADVAATTLTAPGAIGDTVKLVSDGAKWVMTAMYGVWTSA